MSEVKDKMTIRLFDNENETDQYVTNSVFGKEKHSVNVMR